jgi:pilus assembly protein Flp/PilA
MMKKLIGLVREEEGQGMVEYGLIIALVSVAVIVALGLLGGGINTILGTATGKLTTASQQ